MDHVRPGGTARRTSLKTATVSKLLSDKGMARVVSLALLAISLNAVLIHTIVPEESIAKYAVRAAALGLVGLGMILNQTRLPLTVFLLICGAVALLALRLNPDQFTYIFVLVIVAAMLGLDERQVGRGMVFGSLAAFALVFVLLRAGLTYNVILDFRGRATYGTTGVPFFYNLVYGAATMLMVHVRKYKTRLRWLVWATCVAGATYFYQQTDARGGYLALMGFTVLSLILPLLARLGVVRLAIGYLPVLFLGAAFAIASLEDNWEANIYLSFRPQLFAEFLRNVGLTDVLLGTSVKNFEVTVDSSYLHLLMGGGVLMCLAFFVLYRQAVRSLFEQKRHVEVAFLVATCFYFNTESILLRAENLFVIFFWFLIVKNARVTTVLDPVPPEIQRERLRSRAAARVPA